MEIEIIETGEKKSLDPIKAGLSDIHMLIYKNSDDGYSMSKEDFSRLDAKSKK